MFTHTDALTFAPKTATVQKPQFEPAVRRFYQKHPLHRLTHKGAEARRNPDAIALMKMMRLEDGYHIVASFEAARDEWHILCAPGGFLSALRTWLDLIGIARKDEWHDRVLPELQILAVTAAAMTGQSQRVREHIAELQLCLGSVRK